MIGFNFDKKKLKLNNIKLKDKSSVKMCDFIQNKKGIFMNDNIIIKGDRPLYVYENGMLMTKEKNKILFISIFPFPEPFSFMVLGEPLHGIGSIQPPHFPIIRQRNNKCIKNPRHFTPKIPIFSKKN